MSYLSYPTHNTTKTLPSTYAPPFSRFLPPSLSVYLPLWLCVDVRLIHGELSLSVFLLMKDCGRVCCGPLSFSRHLHYSSQHRRGGYTRARPSLPRFLSWRSKWKKFPHTQSQTTQPGWMSAAVTDTPLLQPEGTKSAKLSTSRERENRGCCASPC